MSDHPIQSLEAYSRYIAEACDRSDAKRSTITVWSVSKYTGIAEGEVFLSNDPALAATHPHHKHIPPDIKHNRVPAPGISFRTPNLLQILQEIEDLIENESR